MSIEANNYHNQPWPWLQCFLCAAATTLGGEGFRRWTAASGRAAKLGVRQLPDGLLSIVLGEADPPSRILILRNPALRLFWKEQSRIRLASIGSKALQPLPKRGVALSKHAVHVRCGLGESSGARSADSDGDDGFCIFSWRNNETGGRTLTVL